MEFKTGHRYPVNCNRVPARWLRNNSAGGKHYTAAAHTARAAMQISNVNAFRGFDITPYGCTVAHAALAAAA